MYYMSPVMFVTMLCLSLHIERPLDVFRAAVPDQTPLLIFLSRSLLIMAVGGIL
ncbi:hypothetical protein BDF20DRAFT_846681, partial [Mycotypha africana]|uniref:uncharacterized protein n=1 Tax=Mycotypha africana TaxID=64632 RepID=UPI0023014BFA